jgi:acetyl esterase/lipase
MYTSADSTPVRPSLPRVFRRRLPNLPIRMLFLGLTTMLLARAEQGTIFDGMAPENRAAYEAAGMRLWTGAAPKAKGETAEDIPMLYPVLPPKAGSPVGALIVFPGGGYNYLSAHEGFPIAERFRAAGLATFVLKYRIRPYDEAVSLLDAQRAVRLVRARAAELGVDPDKIAVIGFSAGGHLAANLSTHADGGKPFAGDPIERQSCRPQTALLIYPRLVIDPILRSGVDGRSLVHIFYLHGLHRDVDAQTPPTFMVVGYNDDNTPYEHCLAYTAKLHEAGVRFELHVLGVGGHGFSLSVRDPRLQVWPQLALGWLATCEFLRMRVGDTVFTGSN